MNSLQTPVSFRQFNPVFETSENEIRSARFTSGFENRNHRQANSSVGNNRPFLILNDAISETIRHTRIFGE